MTIYAAWEAFITKTLSNSSGKESDELQLSVKEIIKEKI